MNPLCAQDIVTPEVQAAVVEVLARMTIAQVTREEVDIVQREVLKDIELFSRAHPKRGIGRQRIYEPSRSWTAEDGPALQEYYATTDVALREKGLKPDTMDQDHCPALVAEYNLTKAEWKLLDVAAEALGMGYDDGELNDRLLYMGLEKRQEFIDIMIGLVVNLPGKEVA